MSEKNMIEVVDAWKNYDNGNIAVLKGVSMTVAKGELLALCGISGCGKSTLLSIIAGLEDADTGKVIIDGREWKKEQEKVTLLRREIGFIFQLHHLMPDLTLAENCMVPVVAVQGDTRAAKSRMKELAEQAGIAQRLSRPVRELSGGERQRGALVRALMNNPNILLADEPTGALDEVNRENVFSLIVDLVKQNGKTLIMATHDLELANRCDRILRMRDGKILATQS